MKTKNNLEEDESAYLEEILGKICSDDLICLLCFEVLITVSIIFSVAH